MVKWLKLQESLGTSTLPCICSTCRSGFRGLMVGLLVGLLVRKQHDAHSTCMGQHMPR
jgi:hypothetical protein